MKKQNHRKNYSSANQNASQMTPKIISDMKQNNCALTTDFKAPLYALAPYANPADELYGAKGAITQALRKCHAVFESGVENTWQRSEAIGASLFVKEIIQLVKTIAGEKTYSVYMIRNCLHIWMPKDGNVGVIKLSNDEDKPRHCPAPRHKFYLIKK